MLTADRCVEMVETIHNKTERCMRYIQERGHIGPDWISAVALDMECSMSTVYRARRQLLEMQALNKDGEFVGRFIQPEEIASMFDDIPKIVRIDELADELFTTGETLWASLCWAERCGYIRPVNGGRQLMYTRGAA